MIRELTCIICPRGCEMQANIEGNSITEVKGALCKRGEEYAEQEILDPRRNIATSILVTGGELPLASVRLTAPIPKSEIFRVMERIKKEKLVAPTHVGQIAINNVCDLGVDVMVTKEVASI